MDDIKRLAALLIASSMLTANMTCALVSADEISDAGDVQSLVISVEDTTPEISEDMDNDPDMISDAVEDQQDTQDDSSGEDQSDQDSVGDQVDDEDAESSENSEEQDAFLLQTAGSFSCFSDS